MRSLPDIEAALLARLERLIQIADRSSRGWLGVGRHALQGMQAHGGTMVAASLAFYALFSLFPLMLLLSVVASAFFASEEAQASVATLLQAFLPAASAVALVEENVQRALSIRGPVGLLAGASLAWGASGIFSVMGQAINRAWEVETPRPFWRERLLAVALLGILGLLLFVSIALTAGFGVIRNFQIPVLGWQPLQDNRLWGWATQIITLGVTFLLFAGLYGVFPHRTVRCSHLWPGALLASALWEAAKNGFVWYLSRFARYNLVYGSVGAVIVLLLWSYITGLILLWGAEFTAQTAGRAAGRVAVSRGSPEP